MASRTLCSRAQNVEVDMTLLVLMWRNILQVFYQGIDKVSNVVEKKSSPEAEPQEDHEGEAKPGGADADTAEGGGDATADAAEDLPVKDDDEQDEDGGAGEATEMTDEELAARCRESMVYRCCHMQFVSMSQGGLNIFVTHTKTVLVKRVEGSLQKGS